MSMHSIESFMEHLAKMAVAVTIADHKALEAAAKVVEKEAKSEFGTYQGAIGGFQKWEELADSTKADRVGQGYTENDPLLRSGKERDGISHKVEHLTAAIGSESDVMVYLELGTEKMPPRPVLGPSLMRKEHQVVKILGAYAATALLAGSAFSHLPLVEHEKGD